MKVLIRTDASIEIGSGHLMRCLTLADQLRIEGAEVAFICRDLPGGMFDLLRAREYKYIKLPMPQVGNVTQESDAEETINAAGQLFTGNLDWLVVDHYQLGALWERRLRTHTNRLMVIDDLANRPHDCDLLLDQNYYRNKDQRYLSLIPEQCITLLGPEYLLLRPEFAEIRSVLRQRDGSVQRILVFFGGSDPARQTPKVLEELQLLGRPDIKIDVVVGSANPDRELIQALCEKLPNVYFHCQIENMAELIASADLGIGAGGAAMWERCCLGLPTVTVVFAANQERTTEDVADIGAIEYIGWVDRLIPGDYVRAVESMLGDAKKLQRIGAAALGVLPPSQAALPTIMASFV